MKIIDIAHPPMKSEDAEILLNETLRSARNSSRPSAIKIVHGHGGNGTLKQTVLNWTYANRHRIRAIIPGERYGITDKDTAAMRRSCGQEPDSDLDRANPGMTIIWIED